MHVIAAFCVGIMAAIFVTLLNVWFGMRYTDVPKKVVANGSILFGWIAGVLAGIGTWWTLR